MQNKAVSPAGSSRTSRSASMGTATTRSLSWRSSAASPGGLEEDVVVAVQRPVAGVLDGGRRHRPAHGGVHRQLLQAAADGAAGVAAAAIRRRIAR